MHATSGHPARLASEITRNRQELERAFKNQGCREVEVTPFYASEGPVTWTEWHRVMGTEHMPEAAAQNLQAFLEEQGQLPATNIPKLACQIFRLREEERLRKAGVLDDAHTLSLPTRVEMEYLIKGGLSLVEGHDSGGDPADREALREQSLSEQEQVWLRLEREATNTQRLISAREGLPNRLGVYLGNVAAWIHDGGNEQGSLILGPSYRDRPSKPGVLVWQKGLMKYDLPQFRAYVIHDLDGFWPVRERYRLGDESPGDDVGFYLVVRWRRPSPSFVPTEHSANESPSSRLTGPWTTGALPVEGLQLNGVRRLTK